MAEEQPSGFKYEIAGNNVVLVIHLFGLMDSKALTMIEQCHKDILSHQEARFVIFNFSRVVQISGDAIQSLVNVQKSIRAKPAELRLCAISEPQYDKLNRMGVIRLSEVSDSVREAISSIL